jgi:hypothetical protein
MIATILAKSLKCISIIATFVAMLSLPGSLSAQTTLINIKDLAAEGLTLTPSTSTDFNAKIKPLIGTPSPVVTALLPYSVVLTNATNNIVRAYAIRWSYIDTQGRPDNLLRTEQNFDRSLKSVVELPPGGSRVLSPLGPIDNFSAGGFFSSAPRAEEVATLSGKISVTASLDSVVFDGGR